MINLRIFFKFSLIDNKLKEICLRIKDIIMVFIVIGLVFCLSLQFIYHFDFLTKTHSYCKVEYVLRMANVSILSRPELG